jgi:hypothetical protein
MRKIACRILVSIVTFLLGLTCGPSPSNSKGIPPVGSHSRYISEIRLQRQGCVDPSFECRKYDVTFNRDGTAQFFGYENSPDFLGGWHTRLKVGDFERLVQLLEKERFFDLKVEYGKDWVDEKQTITVVTNDGIRTVTAYNSVDIPPELWTITGMLDYQVFDLCWDEDTPKR